MKRGCKLILTTAVAVTACALLVLGGGFASAQQLECNGDCKCLDVVLVVDDTGSMGGAIGNVKAELPNIIAAAQEASIGDGGDAACLRMALVTFKDTVEVDQPFTSNMAELQTAINALGASGGAGEPEASDMALEYVLTLDNTICGAVAEQDGPLGGFREDGACPPRADGTIVTKIAVLITDARPGGCDDTFTLGVDDVHAQAVADMAAAADPVRISAVFVPTSGDPFGQIVPIMQNYATTTGGVYMEVNPDGTGTGAAIQDIIAQCGEAPPECPECPPCPECPDPFDLDEWRSRINDYRQQLYDYRDELRSRFGR